MRVSVTTGGSASDRVAIFSPRPRPFKAALRWFTMTLQQHTTASPGWKPAMRGMISWARYWPHIRFRLEWRSSPSLAQVLEGSRDTENSDPGYSSAARRSPFSR